MGSKVKVMYEKLYMQYLTFKSIINNLRPDGHNTQLQFIKSSVSSEQMCWKDLIDFRTKKKNYIK